MNWANIATFSRVVLIPVVIICYHLDAQSSHLLAAILFSIASLTDWLDGFLARKLNQTTPFGAFIGPGRRQTHCCDHPNHAGFDLSATAILPQAS